MGRYAARRALHGLIVILGVTALVFVVTRLIGDPVRVMLPTEATDAERVAMAHRLGFDQPIALQALAYARGVATGDFGISLWQDRPAAGIVFEALPRTLLLVAIALAVAIPMGCLLGAVAALKAGDMVDRVLTAAGLIGLSLPQFWLGLVLILVFAVWLGWLPASGNEGMGAAVLPALALALPSVGRIALVARAQLIEEMRMPYARTAEARGLRPGQVLLRHAARNAANAVLTIISWEAIRMLAGYAVVVETVFAWPGIGLLAVQAIERQDLILLQAIVFAVAIVVVVLNFLTDLAYRAVDPRVSLG